MQHCAKKKSTFHAKSRAKGSDCNVGKSCELIEIENLDVKQIRDYYDMTSKGKKINIQSCEWNEIMSCESSCLMYQVYLVEMMNYRAEAGKAKLFGCCAGKRQLLAGLASHVN